MSRLGKYLLNETANPMRIILRLSMLCQLFLFASEKQCWCNGGLPKSPRRWQKVTEPHSKVQRRFGKCFIQQHGQSIEDYIVVLVYDSGADVKVR